MPKPKLPELCEGWHWNLTRPSVRCTNPKCCADDSGGHPKVVIELLLHAEVRCRAVIDVELYGDGRAVTERAQLMLDAVAAEQMSQVWTSEERAHA